MDVISGVGYNASSSPSTATLTALAVNYNLNTNDTEAPAAGLPIATQSGVTLSWTGLPPGASFPATASLTLLNSTFGWAKPVWVAWGSPTYPNASEIAAEMAASQPFVGTLPVAVAGGVASVTLPPLEPYAVALVALDVAL